MIVASSRSSILVVLVALVVGAGVVACSTPKKFEGLPDGGGGNGGLGGTSMDAGSVGGGGPGNQDAGIDRPDAAGGDAPPTASGGIGGGGIAGTGGGVGGTAGTGAGAAGGMPASGTGGGAGAGGTTGPGGVIGTGGIAGTGGARGTGGAVGTGGVIGTGGIAGTGEISGSGGSAGNAGQVCNPACVPPTGGTTICVSGACMPSCFTTGQSICNGSCMALNTANNCGGCGVPCDSTTQTCTASGNTFICTLNAGQHCSFGNDCSSGQCVYFYSDFDHDGYPSQDPAKRSSFCDVSPSADYLLPRADGKWDCCDYNSVVNPGITDFSPAIWDQTLSDPECAAHQGDANCDGTVQYGAQPTVGCTVNGSSCANQLGSYALADCGHAQGACFCQSDGVGGCSVQCQNVFTLDCL
jgi:hypothetical protein